MPANTQQTLTTDQITERLSKTIKAYQEFIKAMKELEEKEKQLVHDTIKKIDDDKAKAIREKIANL